MTLLHLAAAPPDSGSTASRLSVLAHVSSCALPPRHAPALLWLAAKVPPPVTLDKPLPTHAPAPHLGYAAIISGGRNDRRILESLQRLASSGPPSASASGDNPSGPLSAGTCLSGLLPQPGRSADYRLGRSVAASNGVAVLVEWFPPAATLGSSSDFPRSGRCDRRAT